MGIIENLRTFSSCICTKLFIFTPLSVELHLFIVEQLDANIPKHTIINNLLIVLIFMEFDKDTDLNKSLIV